MIRVLDEYYAIPVEDRRAASTDTDQYDQITAVYEDLLKELNLKGSPLYSLLMAVKTPGSIDYSIDIAIEIGVIPQIVVKHLGFILNAMARLILRPEDIPKLSDYLLPEESSRLSHAPILTT